MKIYVVRHVYDNGESYEDYREYQNDFLYSSLELATAKYESAVNDPKREGRYYIIERELDDGNTEGTVLKKSDYVKCSSDWDDFDDYIPTPDPDILQEYREEPMPDEDECPVCIEALQDIIDSSTPLVEYLTRYKYFVTLADVANSLWDASIRDFATMSTYCAAFQVGETLEGGGVLVGAGQDSAPMDTFTFYGVVFEVYGYGDGLLIRFYPESFKDNKSFVKDELWGIWFAYDMREEERELLAHHTSL